jgi:hypothetical protein
MQFKSRYTGELVLSKEPIRTRRPIKQGESISFSAKTVDMFGGSIRALALQGKLAPIDDEARAFIESRPVAEVKEAPKEAAAPPTDHE